MMGVPVDRALDTNEYIKNTSIPNSALKRRVTQCITTQTGSQLPQAKPQKQLFQGKKIQETLDQIFIWKQTSEYN